MSTIAPYPLSWPDHIERSKRREKSQFRTELPGAIKNVQTSLRLFASESGKAMSDVVISSNVTLGINNPEDPGVAVWFTWDGMTVCIPVDRYAKTQENLQAIHHVLGARRTELRHGTLALVRASMKGFIALPAPSLPEWWQILGVKEGATAEEINAAHRRASIEAHPDKPGGSHQAMSIINAARDQGLRGLKP